MSEEDFGLFVAQGAQAKGNALQPRTICVTKNADEVRVQIAVLLVPEIMETYSSGALIVN